MSLVRTVLATPIGPGDLIWNLASTIIGFPPVGSTGNNQPVLVDGELAFIVSVPVGGRIVVRGRGSEGTQALPHDVNAPVITSGVAGDFPINVPGAAILRPLTAPAQVSYGQDGAINVPVQDTKAFLTKVAAGAYTLGPSSLASNGTELKITSTTAFAHVISAPSLFDTGAAGSPFSTCTFPAAAGASISMIAQNGFWNVANVSVGVVFT